MSARTSYLDAHLVSVLAGLPADTAERIAFVYAQSHGLNVDDRTAFVARVAAAVAEHAANAPKPTASPDARSYVVGLPVVITIDGQTVTAEVDLSEVGDIDEHPPVDDKGQPLYDDDQIDADVALVTAPDTVIVVL